MAYHDDRQIIVATTASVVTDAAVAKARVHNPSPYDVWLQATTANTAPTSRGGAIKLGSGQTLAGDIALSDLFLGLGAGPFYLWAFADVAVKLSVSHG